MDSKLKVTSKQMKKIYSKRATSKFLYPFEMLIAIIILLTVLSYTFKFGDFSIEIKVLIPMILTFIRKYLLLVLAIVALITRKKVLIFILNIGYVLYFTTYLLWVTVPLAVAGTLFKMGSDEMKEIGNVFSGVSFGISEGFFMLVFLHSLLAFIFYKTNYNFDKKIDYRVLEAKKIAKRNKTKYKKWEQEYIKCLKLGDVDSLNTLVNETLISKQ